MTLFELIVAAASDSMAAKSSSTAKVGLVFERIGGGNGVWSVKRNSDYLFTKKIIMFN